MNHEQKFVLALLVGLVVAASLLCGVARVFVILLVLAFVIFAFCMIADMWNRGTSFSEGDI